MGGQKPVEVAAERLQEPAVACSLKKQEEDVKKLQIASPA
jgi:hypothetical protein